MPDDEDTIPVARPCANCGGVVGADGYCETCGTKAPSERDHYTEQPAPWVAACCDRGIRHHRNEDATAIAADPEPGSRAVLVVCDGVSTSLRLRRRQPGRRSRRPGTCWWPASRPARHPGQPGRGASPAALEQAAAAANAAVIANTAPDSENAASCTFAAAVLEGDLIVFGNVGDSRVYWIPDPGAPSRPLQLSVDDSVAQARIAMGVAREEAENGPQAHAITKWLGRDSPDFVPDDRLDRRSRPRLAAGLLRRAVELRLRGQPPCRRWSPNSSATDADAAAAAPTHWWSGPTSQGGKDNISVALARVGPPLS